MAGLVNLVQWVWGFSVAAQAAVCGVLFFKGNFRNIPVFTAYIAANVCQAGLLYMIYNHFGFGSRIALVLAWSSQAGIQILRALATTEILRLILKPYRGIWGLGWRVLAVAFGVVFSYAAIESGRNIPWAIVLVDRGFHLAFAVALVGCLLVIRSYSIPVHSVYKALLGGFCVYSCTVVLANTIGGALFLRGNADFQKIWQATSMASFVAVSVVWAAALRKPLPGREERPASPTTSAYWEISPEINQRLRLLNEKLNQFWKPEATHQ